MKRLIPYIAFTCLAAFTTTSGIPVIAGGCNSHKNKTAKIECAEEDMACQTERAEKFDIKDSVKS